ncbi:EXCINUCLEASE ABC SUBUNIT C [Mycoplasmopsis pulmonis]|uniref:EXCINUCLEASE ABC SUBUNIT C n=1 Tax=Mycoplasmopsis pulmonis (strain UAB CTIP) TaxID=272635 RepID=Q98R54_MYCPU|nr:GIY-YIG nuclease family protein [Mycoplasmopsis pulmonis]CAC13329.1 EXCINUCLEASE ABC SUBUNIT C [Mycoplasmopsis pulmonis]
MDIRKLDSVPKKPGVYFWKDQFNSILYIGKANNLNDRMKQYFKGSLNSYKTHALVEKIANFEIIIVQNPKEALILERNLIRKHKPYYNILLSDDKRFSYIKIFLNKDGLEISIARRVYKNSQNTLYYGPFPTGHGSSIILKLLQREALYENGIFIENKDSVFWKQRFEKIKDILSFKNNLYLNQIKEKMLIAAQNYQFEVANNLKLSHEYLMKLKESQIAELKKILNIDVISIIEKNGLLFSTIFFYKYGVLLNKVDHIIEIKISFEASVEEFINEFYKNKIAPNLLILDKSFLKFNLELNFETKVLYPKKGIYKKLIDLVNENTLTNINEKEKVHLLKIEKTKNNLDKLSNLINVKNLHRIVMMDNSHFANFHPISVVVSYIDGIKNTNEYRKFNLDVNHDRKADIEYFKEGFLKYINSKSFIVPDLFIVDGSFAQLHEVKKQMKKANLTFPIIALVKDDFHRTKKLIDTNEKEHLLEDKEVKNFLSMIQNEVDQFAKKHHYNRRDKSSLEGSLLNIKGLGPKMEKKLISHFETYSNIYNASEKELAKVIPLNIAKKIKSTI